MNILVLPIEKEAVGDSVSPISQKEGKVNWIFRNLSLFIEKKQEKLLVTRLNKKFENQYSRCYAGIATNKRKQEAVGKSVAAVSQKAGKFIWIFRKKNYRQKAGKVAA